MATLPDQIKVSPPKRKLDEMRTHRRAIPPVSVQVFPGWNKHTVWDFVVRVLQGPTSRGHDLAIQRPTPATCDVSWSHRSTEYPAREPTGRFTELFYVLSQPLRFLLELDEGIPCITLPAFRAGRCRVSF